MARSDQREGRGARRRVIVTPRDACHALPVGQGRATLTDLDQQLNYYLRLISDLRFLLLRGYGVDTANGLPLDVRNGLTLRIECSRK